VPLFCTFNVILANKLLGCYVFYINKSSCMLDVLSIYSKDH